MTASLTITALNAMDRAGFTTALRDVFEESPWIPERAFDQRPFANVATLHAAMVQVVDDSSAQEKMSLLRAHPQLAGKRALAGELTKASAGEQAGVGLSSLTQPELEQVDRLNKSYQSKFGFPFIVAVRKHTKSSILAEWERRLGNPVDEEVQTGLEQVYLIAQLRLEDKFVQTGRSTQEEVNTMGKLSTHVLDTVNGRPAGGVRIDFSVRDAADTYQLIKTLHTNKDGRTDELLLDKASMKAGDYELLFHVGAYFDTNANEAGTAVFLNKVPVRFTIRDANEPYHVPLLVSPWSYTTYRGS